VECSDVRRMISRELDGALDDAHRREVDDHVGACGECRRFRELLLSELSAHRSMREVEPPASLTERILSAVEPSPRASWMRGWLRFAVPAAAAASAVLGIWIGGLMRESYTPSSAGASADVLELGYLDEYPPDSFGYILTASNDGGGRGSR
jgi:predicted anti-sigma-YlaC factor YlaD